MELNEKEIDKIIKKSCEDVEVPKEIFQEVYENLEEKKNSVPIIKYLSGVAAIIIVILIVITINAFPKDKENSNIPTIDSKNESIESELPVASSIINEIGDSYQQVFDHLTSPVGMNLIEEESQFVGVVKIEKIDGYTNYIKKTNSYFPAPFIISKVTVEKVFKGNLSGELEIMSYGGVISVNDYIKSKLPGQSIDEKYSNLTEEEKEKTFVKIVNSFTMSTIEPEVGKYYLVFMNYNNDLESYQVLDDLIYEYDITNNATKNTDTNEWEHYEFGKK